MPRIRNIIAALFALVPLALMVAPSAAQSEKRIALVIGNAGYQAGALATPANDAGLIAQTLQAAGFDVVGARDLDQDSLRRAFRDFLEKAAGSGPDTVAFIYLSGYGLQLEGENYFVPIDAKIARDADVAAEALRMSDYVRPLAALKLKAGIVVLDAARANPFAKSGPPLAGGLALVEPEPGMLIAFGAAPGTVGPEGQGPYGPYAQALAEMIREGGVPFSRVFDRARLRVNDLTKGAVVPWHASRIDTALVFFERAPDAPPPAVPPEQTAAIRARPIRDLSAQEAYAAALERDTMQGYSDFIAAYPRDPMCERVRAILAARREAITWRRTRAVDTPAAYWSYLRRYPEGPHAADAHRRLAYLAAALEPPPSFAVLAYDLPPPPPEEIVYIRRPVLVFDDPVFAFAPPPPPPVIFLAPPPPEFVVLAPPPPPVGVFLLPTPIYQPVPIWVRPPVYVSPPPNNVIYANVHNTVVINNVTNTVTITNRSGQTSTLAPPAPAPGPALARGAPAVGAAPVAAFGPALPPSVAQKAVTLQTPPGARAPGTPGQAATPLSGPGGQPLPKGPALPPTTGAVKPTVPAAAVAPGVPTPAPGAKPITPLQAPATKLGAPTPPATAPTAPPPLPGSPTKPGTPAPAATLTNPPTPSTTTGTVTPVAPSAKPATPPPHTPAAKLENPPTPSAPSTAIKPVTPPPAALAKPPAPPPHVPAAKRTPPQPPAAAIRPVAPPPPAAVARPPVQPPPAAKLAPPQPPAAAIRPVAPPPPPPAAVARPPVQPPPAARLAPPPPPPAARPAAPAPSFAPAAATARPAPPQPPPAAAQSQAKGGCPAGKTMAVVNGHPTCK